MATTLVKWLMNRLVAFDDGGRVGDSFWRRARMIERMINGCRYGNEFQSTFNKLGCIVERCCLLLLIY